VIQSGRFCEGSSGERDFEGDEVGEDEGRAGDEGELGESERG